MPLPQPSANGYRDEAAHAFGAGSDARINGLPFTANPHMLQECTRGTSRDMWGRGWTHAHRFFGIDAHWPYRQLPAVPENPGQHAATGPQTADLFQKAIPPA